MSHWYLIHTQPMREAAARTHLERQGYQVYLPLLAERVYQRGRPRERIAPLFPRYLFLSLDELNQSLRPVASTIGVTVVVRFGAVYAAVPDRVIRELHARADPETGLHRLTDRGAFMPGMPVEIVAGPFSGLKGIFERKVGAERVAVLLELLGRHTSVRISLDSVVPSQAA